MDSWEFTNGVFKMRSQSGSDLALIGQAVGQVEEVRENDISCVRFVYVNLVVQVEGFKPYVVFTVSKQD